MLSPAELIADNRAVVAILLLAFVFAAFLLERLPPSVVAASGASLFVMFGLTPMDRALSVFSNEAPLAIGAFFIISGALVRTGALEAAADRTLRLAEKRPVAAIACLFAGVFVASAFMNNTPVVMITIPVAAALAAKLGVSRKLILIPLSYVAILGGVCTLIGTSTNLLVDGVLRDRGGDGLQMFEMTSVGLLAAIAGAGLLLLVGRLLLPKDTDEQDQVREPELILTELKISDTSKFIGQPLASVGPFAPRGVRIVAVYRKAFKVETPLEEITLEARDRIVVRATESELLTLAKLSDFETGISTRASNTEGSIVTMTVAVNDPAVGEDLIEAPFLSRFPVRVLGVARHRNDPGPTLPRTSLRPGDKIWVQATPNTTSILRDEPTLVVSGPPLEFAFRRERVLVTLLTLIGVIALAAMGAMPIAALALMGATILLLLRCVDTQEAWRSIDMDVLALIFAMLIIGRGLEASGSVQLIVDTVTPWLPVGQPLFLLICIYALTSLLTELVTNNAVAVIMTPLAFSLANAIGMDPQPLILAVMFGASASFATPVGYQTNTLVYSAGGYRFADFLKAGVPMNIIVGVATCAAIQALHG